MLGKQPIQKGLIVERWFPGKMTRIIILCINYMAARRL